MFVVQGMSGGWRCMLCVTVIGELPNGHGTVSYWVLKKQDLLQLGS